MKMNSYFTPTNSYEFLQSNRNHVTGLLLPLQRDPSIFRFLKQYFSISSQKLDYSLRFCPMRLIVFSPQGLINQLDGVRSALSGKQQGKVKIAIYFVNRSVLKKENITIIISSFIHMSRSEGERQLLSALALLVGSILHRR